MSQIIPVLSKIGNLVKELSNSLPALTFHAVTNPDSDIHFKEAPILICDCDLFLPYIYQLPKAKWVQGTWAGVEKLVQSLDPKKPLPFSFTRYTGKKFGQIMGEYVISNIVIHERDFFNLRNCQKDQKWEQSSESRASDYRIISDLTIGILGVGSIGNRIGQTLKHLGGNILGFGRKSTLPQTPDYAHYSNYYTKANLSELLEKCDYLVSVLPNTPETTGLLDNDILQHCKQAVLINIGRGNVISEESILKAIKNRWLSGAILDVFNSEPLPKSSPLWNVDEIFITPHVSGKSRARDIAEQFKANFELYQQNLPIPATLEPSRGY